MKILSLSIDNYKSLKNITWRPGSISVIVGANASGKSNLTDFLDFLSDVYKSGLSHAVARKGGYENIAYRKMRRSKGAISVGVEILIEDRSRFNIHIAKAKRPRDRQSELFRFRHDFAFRATGGSIKAGFKVMAESLELYRTGADGQEDSLIFRLERDQSGDVVSDIREGINEQENYRFRSFIEFLSSWKSHGKKSEIRPRPSW